MDVSFGLLFGVMIAIYGAFIVSKREANIGIGRPSLFYLHLTSTTAVIFGVSLLIGGVIIAFPAAYELLSPLALQNDLSLWLPVIGWCVLLIGIVAATLSGILRAAQAVGNDIYNKNNVLTPEFPKDDESK